MRVLYLTARYPYSRAEAFLTDEILSMAERTELLVIPLLVKSNTPIHPLGKATALRKPLISFEIAWAAAKEFVHPLETFRILFQLLNADRRPRSILRNLAIFPKALWTATLVRRMRIDHVHAHWATLPSSIAWIVARLTGVPWSFTAHRYDIVEANALELKLESCSFARAISEAGRDLLLQKGKGPIFVIHMGVKVPEMPTWPQNSGALRLIVPANLVPVKGHKYLLLGLAECKQRGLQFSCIIAGDGPMRSEIERLRLILGLEGLVTIAGVIAHEHLLKMYVSHDIDAVLLTSVPTPQGEREGIPVALIEAMSFAIPVIATNCGAISELVEGHGLLIPPADPISIADALTEISSLERRRVLGLKGRERVQQEYNVEIIADRLYRLITAGPLINEAALEQLSKAK